MNRKILNKKKKKRKVFLENSLKIPGIKLDLFLETLRNLLRVIILINHLTTITMMILNKSNNKNTKMIHRLTLSTTMISMEKESEESRLMISILN